MVTMPSPSNATTSMLVEPLADCSGHVVSIEEGAYKIIRAGPEGWSVGGAYGEDVTAS